MEPGKFDPRDSGELLKHMDKQKEVLMEAYRSMLHELQKLQDEGNSNSAGAELSNKKVNAAHEEQKGHQFG